MKKQKMIRLQNPFELDLRSLAFFRLGLSLSFILSLLPSDQVILTPNFFSESFIYWQNGNILELVVQQFLWVYYLLALLLLIAGLTLLLGYRTRIATLSCLGLGSIAYCANIGYFTWTGPLLLALLLWSCFLPLGANYSLDSAMNLAQPRVTKISSSATVSLVLQQCFNYGLFLLPLFALILNQGVANDFSIYLRREWLPIIILLPSILLIPIKVSILRLILIALFSLFHIAMAFETQFSVIYLIALVTWWPFLPHSFWNTLEKLVFSPKRETLTIFYDADCGFCKKVVHILRTFLILPRADLLTAQSEPSIYKDMETYNSWVVVDWQKNRHYKFGAIAYVCSISPVYHCLAPVLYLSPVMSVGNRFYELIANNRKKAGFFTQPLKFSRSSWRIKKSEEFWVIAFSVLYFLSIAKLAFYQLKSFLALAHFPT